MLKKTNSLCTALKSFARCWNLVVQRRQIRGAQLGLTEAINIARIGPSGTLIHRILSHSQNLTNSLSMLIEQLRREEAEQIQIFEAAFVLRYYEEACPNECLNELVEIDHRIRWISAVARAYSLAKASLASMTHGSKLIKTLQIHADVMEKRYMEELSDLRYLCSRLKELCMDIFYTFNVVPNVDVKCGD